MLLPRRLPFRRCGTNGGQISRTVLSLSPRVGVFLHLVHQIPVAVPVQLLAVDGL